MKSPNRSYAEASTSDVPALKRLIQHAFAATPEGTEKWIQNAGLSSFRVVHSTGDPEASASLLKIPMAQFFGGASVPMLGIAGVAVAPEARGRGAARWMMSESLREAQREGFALSALYPSTQALYRSVGYEQAGFRYATKLPLNRIDVGTRDARVRPLSGKDEDAVRACYQTFASTFSGMLDRGEYCWDRVHTQREQKFTGFGVEGSPGSLDGYVFLSQSRDPITMEGQVQISDCAFLTGAAGLRLLGFLADFATTTTTATLFGAPLAPLVSLMDSHRTTTDKADVWMLRIVDIPKALEGRGYAPHVSARLHLEVIDDSVPGNSGTWSMHVESGKARVTKMAGPATATTPLVRCTINGLAPLYSGLYTAPQASLLGWVNGDHAALQAADAIFSGGGVPWMPDYF